MSSWATARSEAPALPRRRRPVVAPALPLARPRAWGGAVWIVVLGVFLAGVVAVNVAVLQLNVRIDGLGRERIQLKADNARLSSQLSSASAAARIESDAKHRLGLVQADANSTSYVQLAPTPR